MEIPEMTNPLSRYWSQPDVEELTLLDDKVQMSQATFDKLKEYSLSRPTGVYTGKMWKRETRDGWSLCWYGVETVRGCQICQKQIEVI